jgi:hypothetical protein
VNEGIIKDIGRSYIVSSLLPASVFVALATLIFPNYASQISTQLENNSIFGNVWIVSIIFTSWLAFVLYSSEDWIMKLYEGYFFPRWCILAYCQRKWHRKQAKHAKEFIRLLSKTSPSERENEFDELRPQILTELQLLELRAPWDEKYLLPTTLGNVLRASETYPQERYGINGITIWPRLSHILPKEFVSELEDQNNRLAFLLNSSLLACLLATISLYIALARLLNKGFPTVSADNYLKIGIGLLITCYLLYRISVNVAEGYGLFIRSGFDLYRFDLLSKLRQPIPETLREEQDTWEKLNEFFTAGDKLGPIQFTYGYGDGLNAESSLQEDKKSPSKTKKKKNNRSKKPGKRTKKQKGGENSVH